MTKRVWALCWLFLGASAAVSAQPASPPQASPQARAYYQFSRAKLLENKRDFDGAAKAYEQAIELDPANSQLHVEYASLLADAGRIDQALASATKAVELDASNVDAHLLLGNLYQAGRDAPGNVERALAEFERAVELDPRQASALYALGRLYLGRHEYDKAAAVLERFARIQPDYDPANYLLALAYSELKQFDKAIALLERSLQERPGAARTLELLATLYEKSNQVELARQVYEKALAADPANSELRRRLAYLYLSTRQYDQARLLYEKLVEENPDDLQALLQLGKVYMEQKDFSGAADQFYRALKIEADNVEINFNLALALGELGDRERAIQEFERLLKVTANPDNRYSDQEKQNRQLFLMHAGLLRQELGLHAEAIATFKQLLELSEGAGYRQHLFLINAYRAARQYPQMLDASAAALARFPEEKWMAVTHGQALALNGRKAEGIALVRAKMAADPKDPQLVLGLAQIHMDARDYRSAEQVLRESLVGMPTSDMLQFQLAASLERQKKFQDAEEMFRKILEKNPDHSGALNYLGYMMADRGVQLQEALALIKRAVKIDPNNGAFLDSLGWAFFRIDNLESAEIHLTKAVKMVRNDATIHEHLGDLYSRLGKYETAAEYYQKSLQHSTAEDNVAKVREKLKQVDRLVKSRKARK